MSLLEITGALVAALILTLIFSYGFKIRGPWGKTWMFFIILFLGIWAANIWIAGIGPTWWGMSLLPAIGAGLLFAFILAATSKKRSTRNRSVVDTESASGGTIVALSSLFWVMLLTFILAIGLGYLSQLA